MAGSSIRGCCRAAEHQCSGSPAHSRTGTDHAQHRDRTSHPIRSRNRHSPTTCSGRRKLLHRQGRGGATVFAASNQTSAPEWACLCFVPLGVALVVAAGSARGRIAVTVYAVSLVALFGLSALYHRVDWRSRSAWRWRRRLDHSMIFMLIAGTYTPLALLALHGPLATATLVAMWGGAVAGVLFKLVWIDAPTWRFAVAYVALGLGRGNGLPPARGRDRCRRLDAVRARRRALHGRCRRPRGRAPGPAARGVRIPRGLPRPARHGGIPRRSRGIRVLRAGLALATCRGWC
jgi:hypothetical protein